MSRRGATSLDLDLDDRSDDIDLDRLSDKPALWPDSALQAVFADTGSSPQVSP